MKPAALLLTLSFLLLLFAFPLAFSVYRTDPEPVLDLDGNPVVSGSPYVILPILLGPTPLSLPPGVSLGTTGQQTVAVTVQINSSISYLNGIPVAATFSPPGTSPGETILTDTPLEINFVPNPPLNPLPSVSSRWNVFANNEIQQLSVGIGDPEDHPGEPTIIYSTFSIFKSTFGNILKFNVPKVGGFSPESIAAYHAADPISFLILTKAETNLHFGLQKVNIPPPTPPESGIRMWR